MSDTEDENKSQASKSSDDDDGSSSSGSGSDSGSDSGSSSDGESGSSGSSSGSESDSSSSDDDAEDGGLKRQPMSPVKNKNKALKKKNVEKIPGKAKVAAKKQAKGMVIKVSKAQAGEGDAEDGDGGEQANGKTPVKKKRARTGTPKTKGKLSYLDMIKDALHNMKDRQGSSLMALRKYIQQKNTGLGAKFTTMLSVQLKKAVQQRIILKVGARYKLSPAVKNAYKLEKDKEKRAQVRAQKIAQGLIKPKTPKKKTPKKKKAGKKKSPKDKSKKEKKPKLPKIKLDPEMEKKRRELLKQKRKLMAKLKREEEKRKAREALPKPPHGRSELIVPMNYFSDVMAIAEFCNHFSQAKALKLSFFSSEMLFKALQHGEYTQLIREIHMVLLDMILDPEHLTDSTIARMDWYEILNVITWQEILRCYLIRTMYLLGESYPEYDALGNAVFRLGERGYPSLSTKSKIAVLRVLLDDCLCTPTIAEAIDQRLEDVAVLAKNKWEAEKEDREKMKELVKKRKELAPPAPPGDKKKPKTAETDANENGEKSSNKGEVEEETKEDDKDKPSDRSIAQSLRVTDQKMAEIKRKKLQRLQAYQRDKNELKIRQTPWGMDGRGNTYWSFVCERKKLFIYGCGVRSEKPTNHARWRFYCTKNEVDRILASLDQTHPMELALHQKLTTFYKRITNKFPKNDEKTLEFQRQEEEKKKKKEDAAKERQKKKEEAKKAKENESEEKEETKVDDEVKENGPDSTNNVEISKEEKEKTKKEFEEIMRKIRPQRSSARRAQAAIKETALNNNEARPKVDPVVSENEKKKKKAEQEASRQKLEDDPDGFLKYVNEDCDFEEDNGVEVLNLEDARQCRTLTGGEHVDTVMNWIIAELSALALVISNNGGNDWGEWKDVDNFKHEVEDLYNLCAESDGTKIPKKCKAKMAKLLYALETVSLPVIEEAEKKQAEKLEAKKERAKLAKERARKRKKKLKKNRKKKNKDAESSSEEESSEEEESEEESEDENEHDIEVLEGRYEPGTILMCEIPKVKKEKKVYDAEDDASEAQASEVKDEMEMNVPETAQFVEEETEMVRGVLVSFRPACLLEVENAFDAWEVSLDNGETILLREDKLKQAIKRGRFQAKKELYQAKEEGIVSETTETKVDENGMEVDEEISNTFREESLWGTAATRSLWVNSVENCISCSSAALVVYEISRQIFHRNLYAFPRKLRKTQYVQVIT